MPKITVLMSVYNGQPFLRKSIESILSQTCRDFEFLIVDDGSTDGSRDVIVSYQDPRIQLIVNEKNLGLTRSLNRGLVEARGTFLARQDADDVSEPTRLARQVAFLDAHPDVALLGTCYRKIDEHDKPAGLRRLPEDYTQVRWCLLFFCPLVHTSVMFRRAMVLDRVGPYDESYAYAQDYDLWCRIAGVFPVVNLVEYLVKVRISHSSMTATYGHRLMEGPRISVSQLTPLCGWNAAEQERNLAAYRAMHATLFGSHTELSAADVNRAIEQILRLLPVFCGHHRLDQRESARLQAAVRSRLACRLIEMVSRYSDQQYAEVRALLLDGTRLHWLHLFARRSFRNAFASFGGLRIIRAVERWW